MTALTEQEIGWINEVAGRLRLIQADATATTPENRHEYLREEVARNLKAVSPSNRKRMLEALLTRFPVATRTPEAASAPASKAETPEALAAQFVAMALAASVEKREEIKKLLKEAGLAGAESAGQPVEAPEEVRKALRLPAGQELHFARLARLVLILLDMVQRLDDRALDTMRDLSPRHPLLRRPQDFRQAVAQFLGGDDASLETQVRMVSSLLGALMVALQGGGKEFGHQYLERFSPSAILEVVESEKLFGWLPGQPSKKDCCWDKYDDLSKMFATADLVDRQIKECQVAFIKKRGLAGQQGAS